MREKIILSSDATLIRVLMDMDKDDHEPLQK